MSNEEHRTQDLRWGEGHVDLDEWSLPALKAGFVVRRAPRGKLVDVGCGEGKLLRTMAHHRSDVELHGTDLKRPASVAAFEFALCDARLPYPEGAFDSACAFDVLEHVPEPRHLVEEMRRILKPGGRLFAFVPVEGEPVSAYALLRLVLGQDLYVRTKDHIQAFTHADVASLFTGFRLRERRFAYHLLGQTMDASFFAAHRLRPIREFWWKDSAVYRPEKKSTGGVVGLANRALAVCNALAFWESTALCFTPFGSAGELLDFEKA